MRRDQSHLDQPTLFGGPIRHDPDSADIRTIDDAGNVHPARATDPKTSHESARAIAPSIPDRCQKAYELIRRHPNKTGHELDAMVSLETREISKRIGDLKRLGRVVVTGKRRSRYWDQNGNLRTSRTDCETYQAVERSNQ